MKHLVCTLCGGHLRRIKKLDYAGVDRWFHSCVDCGESGWEYGSDPDARRRRLARERERQLTSVSGYWLDNVAVTDPPDDSLCPYCATGPCVVMCEPPADDRAYLAAWRSGDFDDELAGFSDRLWFVGYERILEGVE